MSGKKESYVEEFLIDSKMSLDDKFKSVFGRKRMFVEKILVERAAEFGLKFRPSRISKKMRNRIMIHVEKGMVYFVIVDGEGIHRVVLEFNDYYFPVLSGVDAAQTDCVLKYNRRKYGFRWSKVNRVLRVKNDEKKLLL
jgi:hypothetical protein